MAIAEAKELDPVETSALVYVASMKHYYSERARLQKEIEALGPDPEWIEYLIKPLAKALEKEFAINKAKTRVVGPFGLGERVFISLTVGKSEVSLTFEIRDISAGELGIVDYSHKVHDYPEGSMGAINGLCYGSYPIPPFKEVVSMYRVLVTEKITKDSGT